MSNHRGFLLFHVERGQLAVVQLGVDSREFAGFAVNGVSDNHVRCLNLG